MSFSLSPDEPSGRPEARGTIDVLLRVHTALKQASILSDEPPALADTARGRQLTALLREARTLVLQVIEQTERGGW